MARPERDDEELIHHSFDIVQDKQKGNLDQRQKTIILLSVIVLLVVAGIIALTLHYKKPGSLLPPEKKGAPFNDTLKEKTIITNSRSLKAGIESFNRGYYTDAVTEFTNVAESNADDKDKATALIYLGLIAEKKGEYDKALDFFNRSKKYNDNNARLYLYMAGVYRKKGFYDKAEDAIKKSISLNDSDPDARILLGNIYYELGKFDDAIAAYREALEKDQKNGALMYNLASALLQKGDEFAAMETFKKAAYTDRIGEVAYRSYSRLGTLSVERKDYENGITYLKEALKIRPGDARSHYNLGIAYLGIDKKEMAIDELVKAEELGRGNSGMLEKIGEAYGTMKDYERSLRIYQALEVTEKRNVRILARLGELFYNKGEFSKALEYYQRITRIKPATESARIAYLNMGNILDDMEQYHEAVEAYKKALDISRKDHMAWYNMGIAYKHSDKPELAIDAWRQAARLQPNDPKPGLAMASLLADKGYFDEAEKEYRAIAKKWPSIQEPHFKLGTIYYKRNELSLALKAFQRVINLNDKNDLTRRSYINIGMIKASMDDKDSTLEGAIDSVKKALLLKPGDPEALLTLGMIYAKKNLHQKAVDTYFQVLQATRDASLLARTYNSLGSSYYSMAQHRKAIDAFTRGLEYAPSNEELRINRRAAVSAFEKENTDRP